MSKRYWFIKTAADTSPILAESYDRVDDVFPNCLSSGCSICAISLYEGNLKQMQAQFNVGTNLHEYISNALLTCINQPAGCKIFVYVKP